MHDLLVDDETPDPSSSCPQTMRTPSSPSRRAFVSFVATSCLAGVVGLGVATGCGGTRRIDAVNPRPRIIVGPRAPHYSIDVSRVSDSLYLDRLTIRDVPRSLTRGFQNGVGSKYVAQRTSDSMHLVIDVLNADSLHEGGLVVELRYAARWFAPTGELVIAFQGIASPEETRSSWGKKNVEEVMAIMVEHWIGALADARARQPAQQPPAPVQTAPAPPVDNTPRLPPNKPPGT